MKRGVRALGVAESYAAGADRSTLAGAVVRRDRVVDGLDYATTTVGGLDTTGATVDLWDRLDRPDVRFVFLAGVALAWYNVVDLGRIHEATDRPVLAVTFEASPGLEGALREAMDGAALRRRLERYRALPERVPVELGDDRVYVRVVGLDIDRAREVVRAYTPPRPPRRPRCRPCRAFEPRGQDRSGSPPLAS